MMSGRHLNVWNGMRNDRVGEMLDELGVGIGVVGEFLREHIGDELLQFGRQRTVGVADAVLVDVDLLPGPVDGRDRLQRGLVEQDVGAGGAVRLDQNLEFRPSGRPFWPGTLKSISTSTAVPRMPMVATGVSTFMSPCLAVSPATKEMVPATRLISEELFDPLGS